MVVMEESGREGSSLSWELPRAAFQEHALASRRDSLYKAEPTRRLVVPIQSHDDSLDVSRPTEELENLLLGREEAEVADVDGGGGAEVGVLNWDGEGRAGVAVGGVAREGLDDVGLQDGN